MSNSAFPKSSSALSLEQRIPIELRVANAFPGGLESEVELIETHISWVFLLKQDVFKLRKPVNLGFVDFSTIEQRRADCEAEVRLNLRLAPDVYLGIVAVWQPRSGGLKVGGVVEGPVVDWAVHMRRLPDAQRADRLLHAGKLSAVMIEAIARRIARFHAEQPASAAIGRFGSPGAVLGNVEENFRATEQTLRRYLSPAEAEELRRAQLSFIETHRSLIEARIASGKVRDTHGDLRLEHIYVGDGDELRILDCIEFNERFRFADVCADIAFLSMDLLRLGHADLAELLLAKYVEESGDYALYQVVDFYQSYRAFVRGKIAGMVAEDPLSSERTRTAAMLEARRCFRLALAVERPALLPPVLIAVGGVIAAGKSCVAEQLGRALPAVVINTDSTRKQLAGIAATEPVHAAAWSGLYGEDNTQRVYAELFQRALIVLHSGRSVVLDASFRTRALRAAARDTARAAGFGFRFVECTAPASVCRARLLERARGPSVSDARAELFDEFVRNFEPVTELPAAEHCILDTASPMTVASLLDQAGLEHLPAWAP